MYIPLYIYVGLIEKKEADEDSSPTGRSAANSGFTTTTNNSNREAW